MNLLDVFLFQRVDLIFEFVVLLTKHPVFVSELVQDFLFLALHLLERFEFVLVFEMFLFALLVERCNHLLLLLNDGLQGLDLLEVVFLVALRVQELHVVVEIGVPGALSRIVLFDGG